MHTKKNTYAHTFIHTLWHTQTQMYFTLSVPLTHSRYSVINVLQPKGSLLTLATVSTHHRPRGAHISLTFCLADLCLRGINRKSEGGEKKKSSLTLWPLSRPSAGSGVEPTTPQEAPLRGAFVLCYSNSLVTVLNPRGSLTGALGSQAWLLTAPRWKASNAALSPPCSILPWLSKLLGDLSLFYGVL